MAQELNGLDVLVVNAGIVDMRPLEDWDEAGFERSFAIHVKGPFFLVQALLPAFASPASIVLNSSINAHIGMPNSSIYAASKAALLSLARTLSGELIPRGIRVNAVSPRRGDSEIRAKSRRQSSFWPRMKPRSRSAVNWRSTAG